MILVVNHKRFPHSFQSMVCGIKESIRSIGALSRTMTVLRVMTKENSSRKLIISSESIFFVVMVLSFIVLLFKIYCVRFVGCHKLLN